MTSLKQKNRLSAVFYRATPVWWSTRDSNPRPRRCERRALPAELVPPRPVFISQRNHLSEGAQGMKCARAHCAMSCSSPTSLRLVPGSSSFLSCDPPAARIALRDESSTPTLSRSCIEIFIENFDSQLRGSSTRQMIFCEQKTCRCRDERRALPTELVPQIVRPRRESNSRYLSSGGR